MGGFIKPIGGEFWFDREIFKNENNNFSGLNATYLSGGQSAIKYILQDIELKEDEYVLMPSFLCPSILHPIKEQRIRYEFYNIKRDLSIDICDLSKKLGRYNARAVFFIDYFGFYQDEKVLNYLKSLKGKGVTIVEDAVQMFWFQKKNFIGDYTFNSYRKFLPADGSIVLGKNSNSFKFIKEKYYESIYRARIQKTLYAKFNIGEEKEFLEMYSSAEAKYIEACGISGMDDMSKEILSKIDMGFVTKKRVENFKYLNEKIINLPGVKVVFNEDDISDNVPIGIPILINNRDMIRTELRENSIYCPVHWNIMGEHKITSDFEDSVFLSQHILTIPIDHRYDFGDLDRMIICLKKLLIEVC